VGYHVIEKTNDILCSVTVVPFGNKEVRCRMGM